jgi:hypothetical protein
VGHRMAKPNPSALQKLVSFAVHCVQLQQEGNQRTESGTRVPICEELWVHMFMDLSIALVFSQALRTSLY